jgi:predicted acylesterase/phospholipase RssA
MNETRHPFDSIALTLSGGGTRAVGFHLGTLAYLDRVKLLEKVRILSTVSGGSVVGMGYAVYKKEEKHFKDLYQDLQTFIPQTPVQLVDLLQTAIELGRLAPSGRKTLIAVMAEVYNMIFKFCNNKQFGLLWNENPIHLKEIIFNATEFMTGVGFRFHKSQDGRPSGSDLAPLPEKYARKARLADILASSTCIPVGFEPIEFPEDFRWPDDEQSVPKKMNRRICNEICKELPPDVSKPGRKERSIALMDGGVYDNQGIFSVLRVLGLTYDRTVETHKRSDDYTPSDDNLKGMMGAGSDVDEADIDLFIVSDTPLRVEPIYEIGAHPESTGFLDLSKLKWIASITAFLLLGSTLIVGYRYIDTIFEKGHLGNWQNIIVDFFAYVVPLVLLLACVGGYFFLSSKLKNYLDNSPAFKNTKGLKEKLWNFVKKRKFADLGYMIQSRLGSSLAMSSDVFMNRIRFLGYARLLNIKGLKFKTIINVIDSMIRDKMMSDAGGARQADDIKDKLRLLEGVDPLCKETVTNASKVPTQFWLTQKDWNDLLACGQTTMCYNLLYYLQRLSKNNNAVMDNDHFRQLLDRVKKDWELLKKKPRALVDDPYAEIKY